MAKVQEEQLSPESKTSAFGVDKLNTAYQEKISKSSLSMLEDVVATQTNKQTDGHVHWEFVRMF